MGGTADLRCKNGDTYPRWRGGHMRLIGKELFDSVGRLRILRRTRKGDSGGWRGHVWNGGKQGHRG